MVSIPCPYRSTAICYQVAMVDSGSYQLRFCSIEKLLAEKEVWVRQDITDRLKRNSGRVHEVEEMRVQRSDRPPRMDTAK